MKRGYQTGPTRVMRDGAALTLTIERERPRVQINPDDARRLAAWLIVLADEADAYRAEFETEEVER